jgi:hypothetical protein
MHLLGVVELESFRSLDGGALTAEQSRQADMWSSQRRYLAIDGKYHEWRILYFSPMDIICQIDASLFRGTPGACNRCNPDAWMRIRGTPAQGHALQDHMLGDGSSAVLMQVPFGMRSALEVFDDEPPLVWCLITPSSYVNFAKATREKPDAGPAPLTAAGTDDANDQADADPMEDTTESVRGDAPPVIESPALEPETGGCKRTAWMDRGRWWRIQEKRNPRSPAFEIHIARIAMKLSCTETMQEVCEMVARILCPEKDLTEISWPRANQIRYFVIKLDLLHMLRRRCLYEIPNVRRARYLAPDTSPQGNWDFLHCVEDIMTRDLPLKLSFVDGVFDPWGGFTSERRNLPAMSMARGETGTLAKQARIMKCAYLEASSKYIEQFRGEVKGYLSDQGGPERIARSVQMVTGEALTQLLADLRAGRRNLADEDVQRTSFLYNSLEQVDPLHYMNNPIEEIFKSLPEWKVYADRLKALLKLVADKGYKDRYLTKCMATAEKWERMFVHQSRTLHVDFKWEHLEKASCSATLVLDGVHKYWDRDVFSHDTDTTMSARIVELIGCDFFQPFTELVYLFTHAICLETSWLEGSPRDTDDSADDETSRKRKRDAHKVSDSWKGKHLTDLALGWMELAAERVRGATSERYQEALFKVPWGSGGLNRRGIS